MVTKRYSIALMLLCACSVLSIALFLQKAHSQPALSGNISFAAESNSIS